MDHEGDKEFEYKTFKIFIRKGIATYLWFVYSGRLYRSGLACDFQEAIGKAHAFVDKQGDNKLSTQEYFVVKTNTAH